LEGLVKIKVRVLADGSVVSASIVKSSGESILDEAALENVRSCELEPAQKDGEPLASTVIIPVRFKLN
jgi:protein TonB